MQLSGGMVKKALLCAILLAACGVSARAQVVISQIDGGGGNSGATLKNDFVELFNRGDAPVALTGWSVQYASSTGTSWQVTALSGTIQPGGYYLVAESAGTGGTQDLPVPDASGSIPMSATNGKVALVSDAQALSGSCPLGSPVQDFVGFGSANCFEGSGSAAVLTNTTASLRAADGCTDTDNNAADFATGTPAPRNSASPTHTCGGIIITPSTLPTATVGLGYSQALTASGGVAPYTFAVTGGALPPGLSLLPSGILEGAPASASGSPFAFLVTATDSTGASSMASYSLAVMGLAACSPTQTIAQVQGNGDISPFRSQVVTISGITTVVRRNGFYLQMRTGDGDPSTSDGIFIFTSSTPPAAAAPGNELCVTGTVSEFAPSSDPNSLTLTEVSRPTVALVSTGNTLPAPIVLTASQTNPAGALDQLEKYEGMLVHVDSLKVWGPTQGNVDETNATSTSTGLFLGALPGIPRPFREPGIQLPDPLPAGAPPTVTRFDGNPEVLSVDSSALSTPIDVTAGATVTNLTGALDYTERTYEIVLGSSATPSFAGNVSATPVANADETKLRVASFNMERFFDTTNDPGTSDAVLTPTAFQNRLNKASLAIRNVLRLPDIVGVEEMENLATLQALATKINQDAVAANQPNPNYQAFLDEGNDIGGIDVGLLVKTPKVTVISVDQVGKDTTYTPPGSSDTALLNDRPPIVLKATVKRDGSDVALPVTVIVNHLRSLTDIDDPADGARVRAKREGQAEFLANYIQSLQAADPNVNIVSVGDYNAYQFSDGYVDVVGAIKGTPVPASQVVVPSPTLVNPPLTDLVETALIAPTQRYSYSFSGSAQVLDHIIVNNNMLSRASTLDYARNDADFPDVFRNDPNRPERISDHDMPEASFTLPLGISSKVYVTVTPLLYDFFGHTAYGLIFVTNTSGKQLDGPIYVSLTNLPPGVTLTNATGTSGGSPYLKITGSGLVPWGTALGVVTFKDLNNVRIQYGTAIYSGSL
jgi:predicted extracellular nuclease